MASLASYNTIQQFYIAYYQRPADPSGERYWADLLDAQGGNIDNIDDAFGNSPESQSLYGPINSATIGTVIDKIYLALFDRAPDAAGKQFYINGFNAGTFTPASIAYNILIGAQNDDAVDIANKTQAANQFTQTVDGRTYADPDFGQGTSFAATYAGPADEAAGRAYLLEVTSDPTTVPSESETISFIQTHVADPGDPILGVVPGETFSLTPALDDIHVPAGGGTDLVKGFLTDGIGSTLTPADSITGNGNTIFKLVTDVGLATNAPFFEASGIGQFNVVNGDGVGSLHMNAATYGDVGSINLSGADGLSLNVDNLGLSGKFDISIAGGTGGAVDATGVLNGLVMTATLDNAPNSSLSTISLDSTVDVSVGSNAEGYARLAQTATGTDGAVIVGSLIIGDIALATGKAGSATLSVSNFADNNGTGSATAGNLTVGAVTVDIGASGSGELYLSNWAEVSLTGKATVGNLTVGDVSVTLGESATLDNMWVTNWAESFKGNATVSNFIVGNVALSAADSASATIGFENFAHALTSGNATVGNVTLGDVTATGGDSGSLEVSVENIAIADKGKATAGNVTLGNVKMVAGNSATVNLSVTNSADSPAGAATVGSITVGNVDMQVGSNGSASFSVSNDAFSGKGAATAGSLTVGDVNSKVGVDSFLGVFIYNFADGTATAAADVIGDTKIGNVNLYGSAGADINYSVTVSAEEGDVGSVTFGDIKMRVENAGSLSLSLEVDAGNNVGDVKVGNVDLSFGSNATLDFFNISASAANGDVGSFQVGNVSIATEGLAATATQTGVNVYAHDDIGDVTLGNLSINLAQSAALQQSWNITADTGGIGNIKQGNISLVAAANAAIEVTQSFSAEDEIGNVTIGNVTLSAAKGAVVTLFHEVFNSDDIGNITYGNFSITANGKNADARAFISAENDDSHDIGNITAGTVNMVSKGDGANATLTLSFTSADTIGPMKVGNISIELQSSKTAAVAAVNELNIFDQGGTSDLTLGDIKLTGNTGLTADWADTAKVSAFFDISSDDKITIGNISVVGGGSNGTPTLLDNFGDLKTLLNLTAGGDITVGNIDYSGYKAAATIDASGWKGAAAITAAQKDTIIWDNSTKNVMTLGGGKDTVNITNTNTGKADPAAIDQIIGFSSGSDKMVLDLGGADFAYSAAPRTYAQFLVTAANAMANDGVDIFSQKIGSDSFIAFDKDANGTLDFVVEVVGVQIDDVGDFTIV